jgi:hypothetical protein
VGGILHDRQLLSCQVRLNCDRDNINHISRGFAATDVTTDNFTIILAEKKFYLHVGDSSRQVAGVAIRGGNLTDDKLDSGIGRGFTG